MAAEIGLLSVTQIQNLSQSQHHQNQPKPNPSSTTSHTVSSSSSTTTTYWMWNPREHQEEDDSWEVRAFAEDTRNVMGTTWPPRSYTCTFCRREFRSAQALGGHMNVHRRDRARLHQPHPAPAPAPAPASPNPTSHYYSHPTSSFINIPPQELVANGSLCLLYHLPSPNAPFSTHSHSHTTNTLNACAASPSTLLPVSSYPPNNLMVTPTCSPSFDFPVAEAAGINGFSSYPCSSVKVEEPTNSSTNHGHHEELDLELRLGNRSTPS